MGDYMKIKEFKKLLADCITAPKGAPVWSCGYVFNRLTEKQVEILRHAVQANPICKKLKDGSVMLPNGIILEKATKTYSLYVCGQFHHNFDAWTIGEAIDYARKKSALYGTEATVTLYGPNNNCIAVCYAGFAEVGVEP